MLVTHLGAHAKPKEPDLSLETVIDHKSDLLLNLPTPKDDMKNFSTSCNSQNDLLLQLSNDELDITACAPNMTSSPKCLKFEGLCCLLTACVIIICSIKTI